MTRCPACGQNIGYGSTPVSRLRGALATHIKHKHPDVWKGSLSRTLNNMGLTLNDKGDLLKVTTKRIHTFSTPCSHQNVVYGYVRGRKDVFSYPFPVWIASKRCLDCGERWILVPCMMDFLNRNPSTWTLETIAPRGAMRIE